MIVGLYRPGEMREDEGIGFGRVFFTVSFYYGIAEFPENAKLGVRLCHSSSLAKNGKRRKENFFISCPTS